MSPVSGNPKGDVTLVEFFDYQCGYCKRSLKPVKDLLETDRQLRVVWKEFPILGPVSRFAARAAMASEKQGRYLEFHVAVMGSRGKLTEDRVMALAGSVGLDIQRLRRDMEDPAIENYLDETIRLARVLGIRGTPAFVIGDTLVPGVVGDARLKELIAKGPVGQLRPRSAVSWRRRNARTHVPRRHVHAVVSIPSACGPGRAHLPDVLFGSPPRRKRLAACCWSPACL